MKKLTLIIALTITFIACEKENTKPSGNNQAVTYDYWTIQLYDSATNTRQDVYLITDEESIRINTTYKMDSGELIPVTVQKALTGDPMVKFVRGYWKYPMYPKDGVTSGIYRSGIK